MVGHVNKDGEFEGRNTIQHMFDSHLEMIFDKKKNTRTISWGKNRTGAVGGILYYEFGKDGIDFFTEESFESTKNKKSLEDFMFDAVIKYTDSIDKKNSNYNSFKKELKSKISALYKVCGNDVFNANIQSLYIVKELSDKYKI